MHGEHIGIAFDEVAQALLSNSTLRPIEAIQLSALRIDQALWGIDVLGGLARLAHHTPPEGDEATAKMLNEALKKVRDSGEYDKIHAKYFAKEGDKAAAASQAASQPEAAK